MIAFFIVCIVIVLIHNIALTLFSVLRRHCIALQCFFPQRYSVTASHYGDTILSVTVLEYSDIFQCCCIAVR